MSARKTPVQIVGTPIDGLRRENQQLRQDAQRYRDVLALLATAIQRDKKTNTCWLAGTAVHVKAIEDELMGEPVTGGTTCEQCGKRTTLTYRKFDMDLCAACAPKVVRAVHRQAVKKRGGFPR